MVKIKSCEKGKIAKLVAEELNSKTKEIDAAKEKAMQQVEQA